MRSEECCGCLPAYGVCRINFISQFYVYARKFTTHICSSKCFGSRYTLRPQPWMLLIHRSITTGSQFQVTVRVDAGFTIFCKDNIYCFSIQDLRELLKLQVHTMFPHRRYILCCTLSSLCIHHMLLVSIQYPLICVTLLGLSLSTLRSEVYGL